MNELEKGRDLPLNEASEDIKPLPEVLPSVEKTKVEPVGDADVVAIEGLHAAGSFGEFVDVATAYLGAGGAAGVKKAIQEKLDYCKNVMKQRGGNAYLLKGESRIKEIEEMFVYNLSEGGSKETKRHDMYRAVDGRLETLFEERRDILELYCPYMEEDILDEGFLNKIYAFDTTSDELRQIEEVLKQRSQEADEKKVAAREKSKADYDELQRKKVKEEKEKKPFWKFWK